MKTPENVDAYIDSCPPEFRKILLRVRSTIQTAAPGAEESISYGMPTYKQKKVLVHFAAQKKHLGFYPTPSGVQHFAHELSGYDTSRGAIRFPWNRPIPYNLIKQIVEFRVVEIMKE